MDSSSPENIQDKTVITRYRLHGNRFWSYLFYLAIIILIAFGWSQRELELVTSDQGVGYLLGIVGGSMMLLLLLYPLRKRLRFMKSWGPVRYWFKTHMLFGILGPTLILFHCNFSLGSLNSNVALLCMVVVALSGLIGRYIYSRIHNGIYGKKTSLNELKADSNRIKELLDRELVIFPELLAVIRISEDLVLKTRTSLILHFIIHPYIRLLIWITRFRLHMMIRHPSHATHHGQDKSSNHLIILGKEYVDSYLYCIRKLSEYNLYERLFSIWHIVHLPLFIMLVITGIVHVIAVHAY